ncbi:MAG: type II secretion system protein [Campylobacterales bacterium]|nr:type II secretion system protein [Campylobacterales bacterium]
MGHTKGFSLIETLVAVMIASVATLALMQVVSNISKASENLLNHFESSMMMGLVAGEINESVEGRVMNVDEILKMRYVIDHSAIRESLQTHTYQIRLSPKEIIDPLGSLHINGLNIGKTSSLGVQKVILRNNHESKTFFRLTSGTV